MRAISSGACPVDKRLGSTLGLAIVRQARELELEIRRVGLGLRKPGVEPANRGFASRGPMDLAWAKLRNAYAASTPISSASVSSSRVERVRRGSRARGRRGALVALEMLGFGNDLRARRGEERVERLEVGAVEHSGRLRDALDLVEEAVAVDAVRGVLQRVLGEHDHEAGRDPGSLAAQDAAHALDHLAPGAARAHDDAEVRVGDVDAFVEHAGRRDGVELADAEIVEDLAPLPRGPSSR